MPGRLYKTCRRPGIRGCKTMNFITNYKLERYILDTKWEDFPPRVQERARGCGIDLMTALILGSRGLQFQAGSRLAQQLYASGDVPVVGSDNTYSFLGATVAMGHASNSFDIDDGHNMIKGHPGTSFVAGILAAGLEQNITYREYLTTLVIAYDVAVRTGLAIQNHYGFLHSTGTYGAVSTAAGVGRIFGLSKEDLNNALSVADFHAPLTPVMRAVEYPSMNKDGVPFGALLGAMAVLETQAGTTGKTYTLELEEYQPLLDTLGQTYEIMNLYFKPFTCCRWAHQPIQAWLDMKKAEGISSEDIVKVTVHTFEAASRLSKIVPHRADEAQYNIAWPVAAALVHGDLGYKQVTEEALEDPAVLNMMQRLEFSVDPKMDAQFPEKRLAWIEVLLKDGRTLKSLPYAAPGEASDGVSLDWISKKFLRITSAILTEQESQEILTLLQTADGVPLRDVVRHMNQLLT